VVGQSRPPRRVHRELEQALQIIAVLPGAGTLYAQPPVPGVRRVYLRRVAVHLYYTFDDARVIVRALWECASRTQSADLTIKGLRHDRHYDQPERGQRCVRARRALSGRLALE
jgi:plasmid stabilization system protein ParE